MMLLAMLPAMMGWSQDTTDSYLREGYYYNNIPDEKRDHLPHPSHCTGDNCGILTKEMYVQGKDPITIYGVAAAMVTALDFFCIPDEPSVNPEEWWQMFFEYSGDTSTADLYEYLGVYLRDADSLVPHREVMVHKRYDTPAYYVSYGPIYYFPDFCYPMYEKYFDSAIVVADTFYMGSTERTKTSDPYPENMSFGMMMFGGSGCDFHEYHVWKYCYPDYTYWYWPDRLPMGYDYYMIFPILTPEPDSTGDSDTTGIGGDTTLAVRQADIVSRYVTVQPNPAVEEARVLSSFGLERIEAYDDRGRLVAEVAAKGYEATLDIASWPRGTYLLRITTPMGTVTKKLLVQ